MLPLCMQNFHSHWWGIGTPRDNSAISDMMAPVKTSSTGLCLVALWKPLKFIRFTSPTEVSASRADCNVNCAASVSYFILLSPRKSSAPKQPAILNIVHNKLEKGWGGKGGRDGTTTGDGHRTDRPHDTLMTHEMRWPSLNCGDYCE